jgi:hypothetical protein
MSNSISLVWALVREEMRAKLIERIRYPFGIVGSVVFTASIYLGLSMLQAMLGGGATFDALTGPPGIELFIGVVLWLIIAGSSTYMASMFGKRFDDGLMEITMLSNIGMRTIVSVKILGSLVNSIIFACALVFLFQRSTGTAGISIFRVAWTALAIEVGALGFGLFVGGMSLHLKKIGPVTGLLYAWTALALVFAATRPVFSVDLALLPIFGPAHVLLAAPATVSPSVIVGIGLSAAATLVAGAAAFLAFLNTAKRRGTLYVN